MKNKNKEDSKNIFKMEEEKKEREKKHEIH